MQITMLATSTDQYQQPNSFSVDTDGVYFIINNSANGGICNIESMFVGDFERCRDTLVTAYGRTTSVKLVGTIRLVLKDDTGKTWSYDISDVVYDPKSPYSLLGIPFLGKYFARNDEVNEFDEQTWIQSALTSFRLRWDHGKHQWNFKHGNTYLPELLTNKGEIYLTLFCTCISKCVDDKINYAFSLAFTTSPDGIPQPHIMPNDDDDKMDEVQWYSPAHVGQNKQSNKHVCFSKSTKPPKLILHNNPEIEFKLDMNIILKDWTLESPNMLLQGSHSKWAEARNKTY
jgi:hypothetical protein